MVWIFSVLGVCLMFTCSFFNYRQENNTDSFKSYLKDKSFREITIELIVVILGVTLAINFSEILDKRETNARMKELLELGCAEVIASYNANEILLKSYKEKSTSVAEIKYNGVTVKTLTKTGIYAYEGFRGHYVSGNISSDIDYTYILHVTPNYNTIITSHNFLGATVSYSSSGTTPLYWGFDPSTGEIDVTMPSNNNNIPIVIYIDDVCGNQYTLYLFPTSYNSMNVSYGDNSITLTLNENGNLETGLSLDQPWTLGVSNALTGTLMATRSSMSSRSTTISTAGWPKGMYVVRVTIGNEVLTEKVVIK